MEIIKLQNQDSNISVPAIIDLDFFAAIHKAMGGSYGHQ
jgi:hypothetical protein